MNRQELAAAAEEFGHSDVRYLEHHYERFAQTLERCRRHRHPDGSTVLDLGGHWLHQAVLFSAAGYRVTAVDVPATFAQEPVCQLAQRWNIELLTCDDLAVPEALGAIADGSMDLVLMTEVIEHLAFNPTPLWIEIHRILKPGGRVVLSTPNYYALRSMLRKLRRFVLLRGGGISSHAIMSKRTHAHHWKEYSAREFTEYFALLSPDFRIARCVHLRYYDIGHRFAWLLRAIESLVPLLRPDLLLEVDLQSKDAGIVQRAASMDQHARRGQQGRQSGGHRQ